MILGFWCGYYEECRLLRCYANEHLRLTTLWASTTSYKNSFTSVRFEIFMAVTMKNAVSCHVTMYGSCKN
jgi:hypothetical protein